MGSNGHLIVLLIVFGMSAVSWIVGKLREQAAIKRMRDELKRRQDEELRTGRLLEAPEPTEKRGELAELRELAIKRQQQLEQMRRSQKQQAETQVIVVSPSQAPPPVRRGPGVPGVPGGIGGPGGPGFPVKKTGFPGGPTRTQVPQPLPSPKPAQRPATPSTRSPQVVRQRAQPPERASAGFAEPPKPRRPVADPPSAIQSAPQEQADGYLIAEARRVGPVGIAGMLGLAGGKVTVADLRRQIVLGEILGQPLSLRGESPAR